MVLAILVPTPASNETLWVTESLRSLSNRTLRIKPLPPNVVT